MLDRHPVWIEFNLLGWTVVNVMFICTDLMMASVVSRKVLQYGEVHDDLRETTEKSLQKTIDRLQSRLDAMQGKKTAQG